MYAIHDGSMDGLPFPSPDWVQQGGPPKVPLSANMVLPTGMSFEATAKPISTTDFSGELGDFGQDRARGGAVSTPSVPQMFAAVGADIVKTGANALVTWGVSQLPGAGQTSVAPASYVQPTPAAPVQQPYYPMSQPMPQVSVEKKFPAWGWALIGLGGIVAVGGVLYFTVGSPKEAPPVPEAKSVAGSPWWSSPWTGSW